MEEEKIQQENTQEEITEETVVDKETSQEEEFYYDLLDVDSDADEMAALDKKAEDICRWGAARAGVIVVMPGVGSLTLLANEVYMITRLASNRGVKMDEASIISILSSLGATFLGQTLATLVPLPTLQIPIAISVTYGVGKAVDAWIRAGRPSDMSQFKEVFTKARDNSACHIGDFQNLECGNQPLGDESKSFGDKAFGAVTDVADLTGEKMSELFGTLADNIFGDDKKKEENK